jgi:hypothetical protein
MTMICYASGDGFFQHDSLQPRPHVREHHIILEKGMADLQPNKKDVFFSKKNEGMIQRLLNNDFQRRIGGELNEKQQSRLVKTVNHYMQEIYDNPANQKQSIQVLNTEVLQAVVPDFMSYLKRQDTTGGTRPAEGPDMDRIRNDVSSRFDTIQMERQEGKKQIPAPPNFQIALEDAGAPSSLSMFEQVKRQREEEARRLDEDGPLAGAVQAPVIHQEVRPMPDDMRQRIASDDDFRAAGAASTAAATAALDSMLVNRDANRMAARSQVMPVPPDGRDLLFGSRQMGLATANPTLALPEAIRTRPVLPQDVIKAQEDVITYKENEYNLFVYSADRDWVNNTTENRYNFSVNFDPANNRSGFNLSPSTYIKFKNIARIELIKVIMPTEACETLSVKTAASTYDTTNSINVFSYPYLQVRVDELNANGYGTNDGLNNSFGVISYDAYWESDKDLKNRGWARMIPKFLKCQKIYSPTPLATLQKMSIQIQKPDGTLYCSNSDALDVSGMVFSNMLALTDDTDWITAADGGDVTGTYYSDTSGEYIWIQTKSWFSQFAVTQGDRIVLRNITFPSTFGAFNTQGATDFINYLTRASGHVVVDIAQAINKTTGAGTGPDPFVTKLYFSTGSNKVGYSNFIVIRNDFADPTTGSTGLNTWAVLGTALRTAVLAKPAVASGRLLNLNHQIQIIFRVITRDMDSATRLRPDNM